MANVGQFMQLTSKAPASIEGVDDLWLPRHLRKSTTSVSGKNLLLPRFVGEDIVPGFSLIHSRDASFFQIHFKDFSMSHGGFPGKNTQTYLSAGSLSRESKKQDWAEGKVEPSYSCHKALSWCHLWGHLLLWWSFRVVKTEAGRLSPHAPASNKLLDAGCVRVRA